MRCRKNLLFLFILFLVFIGNIKPANLDGTSSLNYQVAQYTFADGDWAKGFVCLNGGFEVPVDSIVSFYDINSPIYGTINLNNTGMLRLMGGDLELESGIELSIGGYIKGEDGNPIILNGDLYIPANSDLIFGPKAVKRYQTIRN